ncbi:integrin alpha-2-like isoform X2 [Ostrea edulis]|uniref:integrin alpha-2-like isoform X2 n=1 Tax=Ostrea edulis TaxID=37623 RepID=UPI0024AF2B5A|nr:integrin alpha-2-like isoform X2 [Ostrea edulis]
MWRRETWLLIFLCIPVISGFNVGIKGAKILSGTAGSMLGYSLDFATKGNNVWLLIGSPKSVDVDTSVATGSLYYCGSGINTLSDCRQISVTRLVTVNPGTNFMENRAEMWLGASVDVGNAVSFCGPRWMRDSTDGNVRAMNGLCYEVPFGFLEGDPFTSPVVMNGLFNSDPTQQFTAVDEAKFNQTLRYGVSASGLSIKYSGEDVLVGSPGVNEFAGGFVHVKGIGYTVQDQNTTAANQAQMYGYAVSVGQFYGDGQSYFVVGGPRDGGSGKVLILNSAYAVKQTLGGIEPGSYFGSALCVVPEKGGTMEKLLVGAPMYSNMQTYSDYYSSNAEQGRVYVYGKSQTNGMLEVKQTLEGSKSRGARFGYAMANVNDMNRDGYNDVVIGAPFENGGQGAVYVYMGYKRGFFLTQTISAASVAPSGTSLSTFGSSFTQHPADFNNDAHTDLAVGAYGSDKAFVLYTNRPITMKVDTKTNLTAQAGQQKATIITLNTKAFTLQVCFDYDGENIPSDVVVSYEVTADTAFQSSSSSSLSRVCFKKSETQCVNKISGNFTIFKAPPDLTCPKSPLQVVVKDDWSAMRGLFVPVVFDVGFTVSTTGNTECTIGCPVVNKFDPNNDDPFAATRKYSYELARSGCGTDNICQSDLRLFVTSSGNEIITGPQAEYTLTVMIKNQAEPSYNTDIYFTFQSNMTLSVYENLNQNFLVSCSPDVGSVKCSTDKSQFKKDEDINFRIKLDSSRLLPLIDSFLMKVEVKTGSNDLSLQDNVYTETVQVLTRVEAVYNLAASPEVYITKPAAESPTIGVVHSVQMVNAGPSNLMDTLNFTLTYPQSSQVKPQKIILNVSSADDSTLIRCQNLALTPEGITNSTYRAFTIPFDLAGNSVSATKFDCNTGGTCKMVVCEIGTFMYDSFISVDVSYEVEQNLYDIINGQTGNVIPDVPIVTVFTPGVAKATVSLIPKGNGVVITKILPSKPVEEEVPVWAIVVPIVIAVIILIVIVIVLWKRGFFIRKYKVRVAERKAGKDKSDDKEDFDNLVEPQTPIGQVVYENEGSPVMSSFTAEKTPAETTPAETTDSPEEKKPEADDLEDLKLELTKDTAAAHDAEESGQESRDLDVTKDTEQLILDIDDQRVQNGGSSA